MSTAGPNLAAVIAELADQLSPGHVTAWSTVLRSEAHIGGAANAKVIEARLIEARPGVAIGGAAARLTAAWQAADPRVSGGAVALALEAAAVLATEAAARRSQVVVSGPSSDVEAVRLTSSVICELIHNCKESLLIVSFAAFGVHEVIRELELAVQRGVRIDLVLETTTEQGGTLRGSVGAAAAFESIKRDLTIWTWPASRRPLVGNSRAALHAKLVAADERIAAIGSANLTDMALAYNLELGVIIRDPEVVRRIVRHFRSLMRPGSGPLERVSIAGDS